jgi:hypothetical protein
MRRLNRVCPNRIPCRDAFDRLCRFASSRAYTPPAPPIPLILNGRVFSTDVEKKRRWEDTLSWAMRNGCLDLIASIPVQHFHWADELTSCAVGPWVGPLCRPWDSQSKRRSSRTAGAGESRAVLAGADDEGRAAVGWTVSGRFRRTDPVQREGRGGGAGQSPNTISGLWTGSWRWSRSGRFIWPSKPRAGRAHSARRSNSRRRGTFHLS